MSVKSRQVIINILICAAIFVVGIGLKNALAALRSKPQAQIVLPTIYNVRSRVLARENFVEQIAVQGTARALVTSRIASQVQGDIMEKDPTIESGKFVKKGTKLLKVDQRKYQFEVDRRRGNLERAQTTLDRTMVDRDRLLEIFELRKRDLEIAQADFTRAKSLKEKEVFSARESEVRESALKSAETALSETKRQLDLLEIDRKTQEANVQIANSELEQAKLDLEFTSFKAPYDGWIADLPVDVGDMVMMGQNVVELVSLEKIEVPVQIPASLAWSVKEGAKVELQLAARPEVSWVGTVARLSPKIREANRTLEAYVIVENPTDANAPKLLPGNFVTGSIEARQFDNVFAVQRDYFIDGQVFTLEPNTLLEFYIEEQIRKAPEDAPLTRDAVLEAIPEEDLNRMQGDSIHVARVQSPVVKTYSNGFAIIEDGLTEGDLVVTTNIDVMYNGAVVRIQGN
jgi:multidrug resistance efflux pump